jgi:hypothetical protein
LTWKSNLVSAFLLKSEVLACCTDGFGPTNCGDLLEKSNELDAIRTSGVSPSFGAFDAYFGRRALQRQAIQVVATITPRMVGI